VAEERGPGGVRYEEVGAEYFDKRGLRRYAGVWSLWALGVGAVISGDFAGWSFGLGTGGFGGLLLATAVVTVMYAGLCASIAEMSAALPHTGGAYSFARSAMGPWGGYVTGLAENMEYILTPATIVVLVGEYLGAIFGTEPAWAPAWWAVAYGVFVALNVIGVELSLRFTMIVTFIALGILAVFWIGALPKLDFARWAFDVPAEPGHGRWLPRGVGGVIASLPFAIWFYLGIEELPLAAEESHAPERDMPRGMLLGLCTLVVCAFTTLVVSAGVAPGANALGQTAVPLHASFEGLLGAGTSSKLLALCAVAGLVASFHGIIFAYGRQIYSLSRAGYFPRFLSLTHGSRKTPHVALAVGALLGYAAALVIHYAGAKTSVGAVLLNMAVFGAVIAYALQAASFVLLRRRMPNIVRPFESPLGNAGAVVAGVISLVTLVALFANVDYRPGVAGAAVWFALGLVYFALWGRHRLVLAPEEQFAREAAGDE
jgi:ethanolamine permease